MYITILDILIHRKPELKNSERINATHFDDEYLPFFAGCATCGESLGPFNSYPSITGYIRCESCICSLGYKTVKEFECDND